MWKRERKQIRPENTIGEFGKWQFLICAIIFPWRFPEGWQQNSDWFLARPEPFDCIDPSIPACAPECPGHNFNRTIFIETIITEWDLVCDRSKLVQISSTIYMLGVIIGALLFGTISDKYGRKWALVGAIVMQLASGISAASVPSLWLFNVMRFCLGASVAGATTTSFVILMEITGNEWRELVVALYQLPLYLGQVTLPLFAYHLRSWRHLLLVMSVPSAVIAAYCWTLPESPRWLITAQRKSEAVAVLVEAANRNRRPTESIESDVSKVIDEEANNSRGNPVNLIRTQIIRENTMCICFNWFVSGLTLRSIPEFIGQHDSNVFWHMASGLFYQLPGIVYCAYATFPFGCRTTLIVSNILSGVCMFLISVLPGLRVLLASLTLIGAAASSTTLWLFTSDLNPTIVRNVGQAMAYIMAQIGSFVATFAVASETNNSAIFPIILGILLLVAAELIAQLPETSRQPLPDTIEDIENFTTRND